MCVEGGGGGGGGLVQTRCIMEDEQMANSVKYFGMLEKVVVIEKCGGTIPQQCQSPPCVN